MKSVPNQREFSEMSLYLFASTKEIYFNKINPVWIYDVMKVYHEINYNGQTVKEEIHYIYGIIGDTKDIALLKEMIKTKPFFVNGLLLSLTKGKNQILDKPLTQLEIFMTSLLEFTEVSEDEIMNYLIACVKEELSAIINIVHCNETNAIKQDDNEDEDLLCDDAVSEEFNRIDSCDGIHSFTRTDQTETMEGWLKKLVGDNNESNGVFVHRMYMEMLDFVTVWLFKFYVNGAKEYYPITWERILKEEEKDKNKKKWGKAMSIAYKFSLN
jgi:hypothetical protein